MRQCTKSKWAEKLDGSAQWTAPSFPRLPAVVEEVEERERLDSSLSPTSHPGGSAELDVVWNVALNKLRDG